MSVEEEVEKKEKKLNESSLTDLPLADEQADSTKAGKGKSVTIQSTQWAWSTPNSDG